MHVELTWSHCADGTSLETNYRSEWGSESNRDYARTAHQLHLLPGEEFAGSQIESTVSRSYD